MNRRRNIVIALFVSLLMIVSTGILFSYSGSKVEATSNFKYVGKSSFGGGNWEKRYNLRHPRYILTMGDGWLHRSERYERRRIGKHIYHYYVADYGSVLFGNLPNLSVHKFKVFKSVNSAERYYKNHYKEASAKKEAKYTQPWELEVGLPKNMILRFRANRSEKKQAAKYGRVCVDLYD